MKKILVIITIILLLPIYISAHESDVQESNINSLNIETPKVMDRSTFESIKLDIDREDRMERCISRMRRDTPNKNKDFEAACIRTYAMLDEEEKIKNENEFDLNDDQVEKLSEVKEERRRKIETLSQEKIEKLTDLNVRNLEKISVLSQEKLNRITDLDEELINKLSYLSNARIVSLEDKNDKEIEELVANSEIKITNIKEAGNKRTLSKEVINSANKEYKNRIKDYDNAKDNYLKSKSDFYKSINKEKELCQESGEDCDIAVIESITDAKKFLKELANQQIAYLEQLKYQIRSSEGITNSQNDDLEEEIDSYIAKVNRANDFLATATTKSEVKEAGITIITTWDRLRFSVKDKNEEMNYFNTKKFVRRNDALETKINKMLFELKEIGMDVSVYQEDLTSISSLTLKADNLLIDGRESFSSFRNSKNPEEDKELLDSAKKSFSSANKLLIQANNEFMQLQNKIFSETGKDFLDESDDIETIIIDDPGLPKAPELYEIEVEE